MKRSNEPLEEIMDRLGLRVIVPSVPACYTVLGLLHSHFRPVPNTFDDYNGLPKENGYPTLYRQLSGFWLPHFPMALPFRERVDGGRYWGTDFTELFVSGDQG